MYNHLVYIIGSITDHQRFKTLICYFILQENKYFQGKTANDFVSLMGMNDESIKYRIKKWATITHK